MQSTDSLTQPNSNYIQMSNMTSGSNISNNSGTTSFLSNNNGSRSSFRLNAFANGSARFVNSGQSVDKLSTSRNSAFKPPSNESKLTLADDVEFVDETQSTNKDQTAEDPSANAVYNFPWDFKLKANPLLMHMQSPLASSTNLANTSTSSLIPPVPQIPPPPLPPQCPPPPPPPPTQSSQLKQAEPAKLVEFESDESQYCAPWDLKLQEEMLKMMAQSKLTQNKSNSSLDRIKTDDYDNTRINTNCLQSNSIKPEQSSNELASICGGNQSLRQSNTLEVCEASEYSPPWDNQQSLILQTIAANSTCNSIKTAQLQSMPAPLASSSAASTLTNNQAMNSLINQFSRTRLSTRSNTSTSSSAHSSNSSLSNNSPPSVAPPPPLPPTLPPPSLNQSTSSQQPHSTNSLSNDPKNTHRCSHHSHLQQPQQPQQQLLCQMSPRLSHRHLINPSNSVNLTANNSSSNLLLTRIASNISNSPANFAIVPATNTITIGNPCHTTPNASAPNTIHASLINEKFCSWGSSNSSANNSSFDVSTFDDTKPFSRQNRGSNHHFPGFTQHHFQTVSSTAQLVPGEIQVAMPVTTLVFSQTALPPNLIPLNIQQSQISNSSSSNLTGSSCLNNSQSIISSSPSSLNSIERQIWYHGRITRKQAEVLLSNKPIGSFLVRQSESGNSNDYSLSLVSGSGCVHMRICIKNGEYILGQCSQPFSSIVKMIEHYAKVEVPIKGAQHVKLSTPISVLS